MPVGLFVVLIVAIVFWFTYSIIKMGIEHADRVARMKHGYPLKDGTKKIGAPPDVIDHRNNYGGNQAQ